MTRPKETRTPFRRRWISLALVGVPRLLAFPLSENLHGDAIARTWLAHLWLGSPHLIGSFDQGGMQFGPLHIYLLAIAEWVRPSLLHAGRVVSLLAGVLTVLPLEALTRRLFGARAAAWAVFGLAFWGLHIQCSTTSTSEALNLLVVVAALERVSAFYDGERREPLLTAALLLNLACATRYDAWPLVPLVSLWVWHRASSRWTGPWFLALSSVFAVAWSVGNFLDRGSALYPLHYIDDFHRVWFVSEEALWGRWRYRLMCLFFWPGSAVATLTPLWGLAGVWGLVQAWRTGRGRWLVSLVVLPAAAYTLRSVVMGSFVPLARFTVKEVALLLPFVWLGAEDLLRRWPKLEASCVRAGAVSLIVFTAGLGAFTAGTDGAVQTALIPISPLSTIEPGLRAVSRRLASEAGERGCVVVDQPPRGYDDMTVSYFSGFPYERQARRRSPYFEQRLVESPPVLLVRWEGGRLEGEGRLTLDGPMAWLDGTGFAEVVPAHPPIHLFRRVETPRPPAETLRLDEPH